MDANGRRRRWHETLALAASQHGVVTTPQLWAVGWTQSGLGHMVREGALHRVCQGLYSVSRLPETAESWSQAALLVAGPSAALAGEWAAAAHGLRAVPPPLPVEIVVPAQSRLRSAPFLTGRRRDHVEVVVRRGFSCLSVEDVVLDSAAAAANLRDLVGAITRATGQRVTTPRLLTLRAAGRPRLCHRTDIERTLRDVGAGMASLLEVQYGRIERRHRLPVAVRQRRIERDGQLTFADGLIEECGVLLEFDGRLGHVGEGAFRDRRRDNFGARHGLVTLRYGYQELFGAPCDVAAEVLSVCVSRGWNGQPRGCPACRLQR
ncbi:MAG: type IV toxin-antitoxin system AbiEi family antitoxin domain-containing protein [Actinomycetes bacterium]